MIVPFSADDHRHMARALALAERGLYTTDPNPRVGCVIVRDGEVVGEGWHERPGEPHAEVYALREAGERARGATCYVTLEPCAHHGRTPPCADALIKAGVARVVMASEDPHSAVAGKGLARLKEAGVETAVGLMSAQAERLNPGFLQRHREGWPFVRCKLAMSLDGRTAMASGESQWITGPAARRDVQRLRARSSAIMTGIGTVLADNPSLTVRAVDLGEPEPDYGFRQPLRIVVDPHLSTPEDARLLSLPGKTLIATTSDEEAVADVLRARGAEVIRVAGKPDTVDLNALMALLAQRDVNEVLLETGATLAGAMLRAGLVDELVVYMAPLLLGDGARGLFHLPGLASMADRIQLEIAEVQAVGADWRITARVKGR